MISINVVQQKSQQRSRHWFFILHNQETDLERCRNETVHNNSTFCVATETGASLQTHKDCGPYRPKPCLWASGQKKKEHFYKTQLHLTFFFTVYSCDQIYFSIKAQQIWIKSYFFPQFFVSILIVRNIWYSLSLCREL